MTRRRKGTGDRGMGPGDMGKGTGGAKDEDIIARGLSSSGTLRVSHREIDQLISQMAMMMMIALVVPNERNLDQCVTFVDISTGRNLSIFVYQTNLHKRMFKCIHTSCIFI